MRRTISTFLLALVLGSGLAAAPARADVILSGSDYLETLPGSLAPIVGPVIGLPIVPPGGTTSTIVQRQADCLIDLGVNGSNCTIPIEMVALSLQSVANPSILFRESPTLASTGQMTITSNGAGPGGVPTPGGPVNGSFDSFFDLQLEISLNGGVDWLLPSLVVPTLSNVVHLVSTGALWSVTPPPGTLIVHGPVGDQAANFHDGKAPDQFDFYLVGPATHQAPDHLHIVDPAVPIPGTAALMLVGLGAAAALRRRGNRQG